MKKINWEKFLQIFLVIFPITIGTVLPILNLLNVFVFNKKVSSNITTYEIITIAVAIIVPIIVAIISLISALMLLKLSKKDNDHSNNNTDSKLKLEFDELKNENKTLKLENQKLSKRLEDNDEQSF